VNTSWAVAVIRLCDQPLLDSIAASSIRPRAQQPMRFMPPDLAMTAWSISVLAFTHAPLRTSIAAQAIATISQFSSRYRANTAWSLSALV